MATNSQSYVAQGSGPNGWTAVERLIGDPPYVQQRSLHITRVSPDDSDVSQCDVTRENIINIPKRF